MQVQVLFTVLLFAVTGIFAFPAPGADDLEAEATLNTYQKTVLRHHNVHRSNHSAHDVSWGPNMMHDAKKLAHTCHWGHNNDIGGGGYGQNIEAGSSPSQIGASITEAFYNGEEPKYHWYGDANPNFATFEAYGHFTQLVWKDTKRVGCWTASCPKGVSGAPGTYWLTICNYWPQGNMGGEYGHNVGRPLGHKTVHGDY
ncbi:MAG: hypothetical protein M1828_001332 [Chrysothrix sp. TS-e1954]|nr:MAG: hypothetical protein M1828_001332 [Chrysothrix sp. TS-e1954]